MSIASSIPTLAEGIHVHDRKLLGYAWDGISGSPTICGSIRVFSRSLFSKFGHEIFERKRRREREREKESCIRFNNNNDNKTNGLSNQRRRRNLRVFIILVKRVV